jgi:fatty-acyl-CoA synthase
MLGYWQDREATAAKLRERWLRTGDLVQRDADGAVTVLGRIDDVINRGGEKVMPSEVESVLVSYPAVLDAGVVGLEDDDLGEIPVAAVVARLGATVDRADLDRFVAARLADFKRPVLISVISALPRNANGKLERAELRRLMTSRARSGQPAATSPS